MSPQCTYLSLLFKCKCLCICVCTRALASLPPCLLATLLVRVQYGVWELQWPSSGGLLAENHSVVYVNTGSVRSCRPLPAPYSLPPQEQTIHLR